MVVPAKQSLKSDLYPAIVRPIARFSLGFMTLGVAFTAIALMASRGSWTSDSLTWSFCIVADIAWLLAIVLEKRKAAGSLKAALPRIAPVLSTALVVAGMSTHFNFTAVNFPYPFAGGLFFCACLQGCWHCITFVFPGIDKFLQEVKKESEAQENKRAIEKQQE